MTRKRQFDINKTSLKADRIVQKTRENYLRIAKSQSTLIKLKGNAQFIYKTGRHF
jgi:hypothetical protein